MTFTLIRMKHGSKVYGTSLPTSDDDFKGVFLPSAKEILTLTCPSVLTLNKKSSSGPKNEFGDIDLELYSLQKYLKLLTEGQTVALDMFFTPEEYYTEIPHAIWKAILSSKDSLITKKAYSFVGYCRAQASKYGMKGNKLGALKWIMDIIKDLPNHEDILEPHASMLGYLIRSIPEEYKKHINLVWLVVNTSSEKKILHLEVCGKKFPFTTKIKWVYGNLYDMYGEYGNRAIEAEKNQGVDWKAMYHAVRVAEEAKELLSIGKITFPRPEANYLLDIRQGKVDYNEVASHIDNAILEIEDLQKISALPDNVNEQVVENLLYNSHRLRVLASV